MRVRLLASRVTDTESFPRGHELDLPQGEALRMIKNNLAIPCDSAVPAQTPERSTASFGKRERR